jgi:hypothetical protein
LPANLKAIYQYGYAEHEYGHYLQEIFFGKSLYKDFIQYNSLQDTIINLGTDRHMYCWIETDANARAAYFFVNQFNKYDIHNDGLWPKIPKYYTIYP